ncbi:MAG: SEC-C metal-binding domain-containing protein [Candidatus Accumulibacter sp. UW20]
MTHKQNKQSKRKRKWTRLKPDEVIRGGPLSIARYGRFIQFSNHATTEEHNAFRATVAAENPKILANLARKISDIQDRIAKYDPVELMHRAAYEIMPLFLKHQSESEYSSEEARVLPGIEYIQYLIARTEPNLTGATVSEKEWQELWVAVDEALQLTGQYLFTRRTSNPPSPMDELRFYLDHARLGIRMHRYQALQTEYWEDSFKPYDTWLRAILKIGADDMIKGFLDIQEYFKTGTLKRYQDLKEAQEKLAMELAARGYRIDPDGPPEEVERTKVAMASGSFQSLYDDVQEKARLTLTPTIFDITSLTALPQPVLSLLSVKAGEAILRDPTLTNQDDLSPLSDSVLHYKPFLESKGRFYGFYHSGFEDRAADIIEDFILLKRPDSESKILKRKSEHFEIVTKELMSGLLTPDVALENLYYPDPDNLGGITELDLLVAVDDILFLVEIKAGGLSAGASRGAPSSLAKDLSDLIIKGQHQSERAERYLRSKPIIPFFDQTGTTIVHQVRSRDYRRIFRIVVTREALGWVGAKIAILSVLDPSLSASCPWHVSIDDLRVIADLFDGQPLSFVHFLEQRLEASSTLALSQHDEIEHVALYHSINEYHSLPVSGADRFSFATSYMKEIDYYFSEKYVGGSPARPEQQIPLLIKELLRALDTSRVEGRFEFASFILSMDQEGRDRLEAGLASLAASWKKGRQPSIRVPITLSSVGLTIASVKNENWDQELLRSAAQMKQSTCDRWLALSLRRHAPYEVEKIERILPDRYTEEELEEAKGQLETQTKTRIVTQKPGRNDPCPCGSGKKYKKCHGF